MEPNTELPVPAAAAAAAGIALAQMVRVVVYMAAAKAGRLIQI